jgi:hypothetical protein
MQTQKGTGYFLEVDTVTPLDERPDGTNYKLVACTVTDGFDLSIAEETTSNKCSDGNKESQPGELSWSMNSDGHVTSLEESEEATRVNNQTLKNLAKNKTTAWWRRTNATDSPEGYVEGTAWINNYNDSAENNTVFGFSIALTGTGEVYTEPATT